MIFHPRIRQAVACSLGGEEPVGDWAELRQELGRGENRKEGIRGSMERVVPVVIKFS